MKKRVLAFVMMLALVLETFVPTNISAETLSGVRVIDGENNTLVSSEIKGSDGISNLLAETLQVEVEASNEEAAAYGISDVTLNDDKTAATVSYSNTEDAMVLVDIYNQATGELVGSGKQSVSKEEQEVTVNLEYKEAAPEYFTLSAYMIAPDTYAPISDVYTSELYTQTYQEFLKKTTEDFPEELVYNLDDQADNNFMVFDEGTIIIRAADRPEGVNVLTDNGDNTYTITNAQNPFTTMQVGDIFAYEQSDGSYILVKIAALSQDGSTLVITAETSEESGLTLEDAFSYVRIDTKREDAVLTDPGLEEGVELATAEEADELNALQLEEKDPLPDIEGFGTITVKLKFDSKTIEKFQKATSGYQAKKNSFKKWKTNLEKKQELSGKFDVAAGIEGSLSWTPNVDVAIYKDKKERVDYVRYFEKSEIKAKVKVKVEGSYELPFCNPKFAIPAAPGVYIDFSLKFVVEGTISGEVSGTINQTRGYIIKDRKAENLSTAPTSSWDYKAEGELYIGFKCGVKLCYVTNSLFSIGMNGSAGFIINLSLSENSDAPTANKYHDCDYCLSVEIKAQYKIELEATALILLSGSFTLFKKDVSIGEWYRSFDPDHLEGGKGSCPYVYRRVTLRACDQDTEEAIAGATLLGIDLDVDLPKETTSHELAEDLVTDKDGKLVIYLKKGTYALDLLTSDGKVGSALIEVGSNAIDKTLPLGSPKDKGRCGEALFWMVTQNDHLIISGTGNMYDYPAYSDRPDWEVYPITVAIVQNGAASIGANAFFKNHTLAVIKLADSIQSIGTGAFSGCYNIGSRLKLPSQLEIIGEEAFCDCSAMKGDVALSKKITRIPESAFKNCSSLDGELSMSNQVQSIGKDAFSGCENLTGSVVIGSVMTEIADGAFYNCRYLETLTMKDADALTKIGEEAFYHCVNLSGAVTFGASFSELGTAAFEGCQKINSLSMETAQYFMIIPNNAFKGCTGLTCNAASRVLYFPYTQEIGSSAFENCNKLPALKFMPGLTTIGSRAFSGCFGLKGSSLALPDSLRSIGKEAFKNCQFTGNLTIPVLEDQDTIMENTFQNAGFTGTLEIPKGIKTIEDRAFEDCGFTDVVFPETLTWIGRSAFLDCTALNGTKDHPGQLILPDSLEVIEGAAFSGCESLDTVYFGTSADTSLKTLAGECFANSGITLAVFSGKKPSIAQGAWAAYRAAFAVPEITISHPGDSTWDGIERESWYYGSACNLKVRIHDEMNTSSPNTNSTSQQLSGKAYPGTTSTNVISATGLLPEAAYLITVQQDDSAMDPLAVDNLLWVGQTTADETGTVQITYPGTSGHVVLYGPSAQRIDPMMITLKEDRFRADGQEHQPQVTVMDQERVLVQDQDYQLEYYQNIAAGTGYVDVIGIGDYSGCVTRSFTIYEGRSIRKANVTISDTILYYTGNPCEPGVAVYYGETLLTRDADYTVTYLNNNKPGTAYVLVTGLEPYVDSRRVAFTIVELPKQITYNTDETYIWTYHHSQAADALQLDFNAELSLDRDTVLNFYLLPEAPEQMGRVETLPEGAKLYCTVSKDAYDGVSSLLLPRRDFAVELVPDQNEDHDWYGFEITKIQDHAAITFGETVHPCSGEMKVTYPYQHPEEASYLELTFSENCAFDGHIEIRDAFGNDSRYGVEDLAGQTIQVLGSSFEMTYDFNEPDDEYYGVCIESIKTGSGVYNPDYTVEDGELTRYTGKIPADGVLEIPGNLGITRIGSEVFSWKTDLKKVVIPEGVTEIGEGAFSSSGLTEVVLPSTLKKIESMAFTCNGLYDKTITIPASVEELDPDAFSGAILEFAGDRFSYTADGWLIKTEGDTVTLISTPYLCWCEVTIPDTITAIGPRALSNLEGVTLTIPDSVTAMAEDAFGWSGYGKVIVSPESPIYDVIYEAGMIPVETPTGVKAEVTSKGVKVSWNAVEGATGYTVYDTNWEFMKSTTGTSLTDTTIPAGGLRAYYVVASMDNNRSAESEPTAKTWMPMASSISSVENVASGITVKWKKSTNATGYKIYRNDKLVTTIKSGSTVSWTDKNVTNGATYKYAVVVYRSKTEAAKSKVKTMIRLAAPKLGTLTNLSGRKLSIAWSKNAKATGYEIWYSTSKSFSSGVKKVKSKGAATLKKTVTSLTKKKTYYVKVRAYKTASGVTYNSAWSSVKYKKITK